MAIIQIKNTADSQKRPRAEQLIQGELALNTNELEPAGYFKTSTNEITKIGSPYVGEISPNFRGAGVNGGASSFTKGELWWNPETNALSIFFEGKWVQIN